MLRRLAVSPTVSAVFGLRSLGGSGPTHADDRGLWLRRPAAAARRARHAPRLHRLRDVNLAFVAAAERTNLAAEEVGWRAQDDVRTGFTALAAWLGERRDLWERYGARAPRS